MIKQTLLTSVLLAFSFLAPAQSEQQLIKQQIAEAQAITKKWMDKKPLGVARKDLYQGQAERADLIISGIPPHVRPVAAKDFVFRHYTGSALPIILQTRQLKTGITPYVIMNPGYSREVYEDLVGIFLTTPQTPPEKVGLPRNPNADYIDFTLHEGTPVVLIEREIFVIPGRPDLPNWLKIQYTEYKTSGWVESQYVDLFRRVDERGGVDPTFMKVKIQSYRQNGRVYKL